jgi:hypothetical protein
MAMPPTTSGRSPSGLFTPVEPAFAVCAIALGALLAAVVLHPTWLALVDWPQQLAIVAVYAQIDDPTRGFSEFFSVIPGVNTYLGMYLPAAWLSRLVGVEPAMRSLLAIGVALAPLAVGSTLAALGRTRWPALLATVPLFGYGFAMGFAPYVMSVPFVFFALAAFVRLTRAPTVLRAVLSALALVWLFFVHALSWLVCGAFAGIGWLVLARRSRTRLYGIGVWLPSLALFAGWFAQRFRTRADDDLGAITQATHAFAADGGFIAGLREPILPKLRDFIGYFADTFSDPRDTRLALAWIGVLVVTAAVGGLFALLSRPENAEDSTQNADRRVVAFSVLIPLSALGLYLLLPVQVTGIFAVNIRLPVYVGLAAIFLVPLPRNVSWRILLMAPAVALGVYHALFVRTELGRASFEGEGIERVVAEIPEGSSVYALIFQPRSLVMTQPAWLHAGAYSIVRRGGGLGFTFFNNTSTPIRIRPVGGLPYPGRRGEWEPHRFSYDVYSPFYEYVLVRGAFTPTRIGARGRDLTLVAESGDWRVYRNAEASPLRTVQALGETIHRASVSVETSDGTVGCGPWQQSRFACPIAEWVWVGPSEQALEGRNLSCIWAHPTEAGPLHIRWDDVAAGATRLHGFAALADSAFAPGAPETGVEFELLVDGSSVGMVNVSARRGPQVFDFDLAPSDSTRTVEAIVSAVDDGRRHFCFDAWMMRPAH